MNTNELYRLWLEKAVSDPDLKTELEKVKDNEEEISDRFYRELEFGTGGLRGVIGAGTNRMNVYTVNKATQGLADYIKKHGGKSVAISYDSRIKSDYFAKSAASVFAGNGIKVNIYSELMPTPMLSWAVRYLKCDAGVMVTASHNPAKYNGYKVYGNDGCQVTIEAADEILGYINGTDVFEGVKTADYDESVKNGMISYIGQDVIDAYMAEVRRQSLNPEICADAGLKVVYTPLNGTGNKPVRRILKEIGIKDVVVVPEQENPDGTFSTCPYPNPEIREALELGLKLCDKEKPDLLLATDPDCDRVGIAVPDGDNYALFSGNEVGSMLLEYVARERREKGKMPQDPVAVKTIVTTDITAKIAEKYGVELVEVLTGFKFIGEQIGFLEKKGQQERYIFGFEESYGYLAGGYVRDKDAVVASMLICEMAAYYRAKGKSLIQVRKEMYEEYGFYCNKLDTFTFEGASGMQKMSDIMDKMRTDYPKSVAGYKVVGFADYQASEKTDLASGAKEKITLPKSNVISLYLEDGNKAIIRPSGTEPKLKVYYTAVGKTMAEAEELQKKMSAEFSQLVK
ncbi:MAG: phospho-sugar mutase [Firmicutes bacterium]|nr:phospho-sugar mutase [[Eubacterium] siraeum]MCM1486872.1 phospho-sugar mutase [Bacillota bacterium]